MRTLDDVIGKLPHARQQKIEARARELIAEELTLQDIRKARKLTQEQMAKTLNIGQDSISRLEKRSDMMLSTLRSYVEAMGGSLELVARFPKREAVIIRSFEDVSSARRRTARRKKPELVRPWHRLVPRRFSMQCMWIDATHISRDYRAPSRRQPQTLQLMRLGSHSELFE